MEFLINPNVSYLLLILGFLTAVLALFSPGTGLLEVGALLTLALAAYGIVNLPFNWWALVVMGLGILPFFAALRLRRLRAVLLAVATLAFIFGSVFLFRGSGWTPAVHPILILLLSPITIGLAWLMAAKTYEAVLTRPVFNPDQLVGMVGQTSSDIRGQGTVFVNGEEWTALSSRFIPAGSRVRVIKRIGLTVEVEPETSER